MDHVVCHFEIPADDPERAAEFYRRLFGWDIASMGEDANYWLVKTVPTGADGRPVRPGVNGGLMKRRHPQQPFTNYIYVESVDDYLAKAVALGGEVVVPKHAVPGMGWFAYFKDPEGNMMGLWALDPEASISSPGRADDTVN